MKMIMYIVVVIMVAVILSGCATPGTRAWHSNRLQEIENAYQSGEISKAEYLELKNEADQVRVTRKAGILAGILSNH